MKRPKLLDTFCGGGGCSVGYYRAGFDVVGVDIKPQPHYPFPFILGDALDVLARLVAGEAIQASDGEWYTLNDFVAIHASPPCQRYSRVTAWRGNRLDHPDMIGAVRSILMQVAVPYVIENVQEARSLLISPFMLCGTHFGLPIRRHRYFESPMLCPLLTPTCQHRDTDFAHDHGGKQTETQYRDAMGCDWMLVQEARQAIPPAYTEWIGRRLLEVLELKTDRGGTNDRTTVVAENRRCNGHIRLLGHAWAHVLCPCGIPVLVAY